MYKWYADIKRLEPLFYNIIIVTGWNFRKNVVFIDFQNLTGFNLKLCLNNYTEKKFFDEFDALDYLNWLI